MEGTHKPGSLLEGLRNTEIKRETEIRNSLAEPSPESSRDKVTRDTDVFGRETEEDEKESSER